jgi:hypothetical protein
MAGEEDGVTPTGDEVGPVPSILVAVTLQEYATPFVSPSTVIGEADADAVIVLAPFTHFAPKVRTGEFPSLESANTIFACLS